MKKEFIDNTVSVLFGNADIGRDSENEAKIEAIDKQLASEGCSTTVRSKFWRDVELQLSRTKRVQEAQGARELLDVTKKTEKMIAMFVARLEEHPSAKPQTHSDVPDSTQTKLRRIND